jgi:hypothetical protein
MNEREAIGGSNQQYGQSAAQFLALAPFGGCYLESTSHAVWIPIALNLVISRETIATLYPTSPRDKVRVSLDLLAEFIYTTASNLTPPTLFPFISPLAVLRLPLFEE